MDHEKANELLGDYLEGELSDEQSAQVAAHVEGCETCAKELTALKETMRSLSGLHHLPPPPEFTSKVERTIRRRSRGRFFGPETLLSRLPFEWISLAIILALIAIYLFTLLDHAQIQPPTDAGILDK
jgi:anti-sigma factor RsiW